jgi:two-component system cell cycle response regulator DivK
MTDLHSWNLLVVEDDPDGQEVLAHILGFHEIRHEIVSTAEEALERVKVTPYTAAIIDLQLPGMDGWRLMQAIRAVAGGVLPCFAITAYHSASLAVKAIADGFAGYIPKPFEAASFVRELSRVIG